MHWSNCPECGHSVDWNARDLLGKRLSCPECGFQHGKLVSGSHANIGDKAYVCYGKVKGAVGPTRHTYGSWKKGAVTDSTWMRMVFGRLLNTGELKIQFEDESEKYIKAALVRVYQEPFDPSKRPKGGKRGVVKDGKIIAWRKN
jgi:hypothetical protein